ncbi:hypothetical protein ABEB36_015118 [Hypothenemus hampei]|uniref:THAP-type domain-containing protein n=1 Tax=Hypothenemus hampei TaxID=57062 RepID=A0ABD1E0Q7_HYPHA
MRFPKAEGLKLAWAKFCNMEIEHVRPSHRLCSNHFLPSDCIDKRAKGGLLKLKQNVIPSVMPFKTKHRYIQRIFKFLINLSRIA